MKMTITRRSLLLFVFLSLCLCSDQLGAQSEIPFIYYYSWDDQAFLISRADGTERSTLFAYPIAEDYSPGIAIAVDGAGWSTDTAWFTWMTRASEGGPGMAKTIQIFNRENRRIQTLRAPEYFGFNDTEWSPTTNQLLIWSVDMYDIGTTHITIYDPATRTNVYHISYPDIPYYVDDVYWSNDGTQILIMSGARVRAAALDGTITIICEAEFPDYPGCDLPLTQPVQPVQSAPEFEPLADEVHADLFVLHPSGVWAFLLSRYNAIYQVSVANQNEVIWNGISWCWSNSRACFGWLPETFQIPVQGE